MVRKSPVLFLTCLFVKEEFARIFRDFLKDLHSTMLSWSLCGMSMKNVKSGETPTEEMIQLVFEKLMD